MMLIGELARRTSLKPDTIRFYERRGLIKPASIRASGYRDYDEGSLRRLFLIRNARDLGFSLQEIHVLIGQSEQGTRACAGLQHLLRRRLKAVKEAQAELIAIEASICHELDYCETCEKKTCPILEEFVGEERIPISRLTNDAEP